MAYIQAPIKMDMYMELPVGIKTKHDDNKLYELKLIKNLYWQKQVGHVWNKLLMNKLFGLCFEQSKVN